MNAFNKISLASTLGILSLLVCTSAVAVPPDISGTYKCSGINPAANSPNFTETVVLKKNKDTYNVQLIYNIIPYNIGTGIFNKDVNDAFSYVYWDPKTPSSFGSVFFTIKPDGSLEGVFSNYNENKPGTETCTKSSQANKSGLPRDLTERSFL